MKKIASLLALSSAINMAAASASPANDEKSHLVLKASQHCNLLTSSGCHGNIYSLGYETASGFRISVGRYADKIGKEAYQQSYDIQPYLTSQTSITSATKMSGTFLTIDKEFRPTERFRVDFGLYLGTLQGEIGVHALAQGQINTPSMMVKGLDGQYVRVPASSNAFSQSYDYIKDGKSYFGGTKLAFTFQALNTGRAHIGLAQYNHLGLDKTKRGFGVSTAIASEADAALGGRSVQSCNGGNFYSSARYAFLLSACVESIKRDRLYDKALAKAESLSGDINAILMQGQDRLQQLSAALGKNFSVSSVSTKTILDAMNFEDPYKTTRSSVILGASVNLQGTHISLVRKQGVGSEAKSSVTSLSLSQTF